MYKRFVLSKGQVLVPRPGDLGELEAVRGTGGTRSTGNSKADGEFEAAGLYIEYRTMCRHKCVYGYYNICIKQQAAVV